MKNKLFLAILALSTITLVSCTKDEDVSQKDFRQYDNSEYQIVEDFTTFGSKVPSNVEESLITKIKSARIQYQTKNEYNYSLGCSSKEVTSTTSNALVTSYQGQYFTETKTEEVKKLSEKQTSKPKKTTSMSKTYFDQSNLRWYQYTTVEEVTGTLQNQVWSGGIYTNSSDYSDYKNNNFNVQKLPAILHSTPDGWGPSTNIYYKDGLYTLVWYFEVSSTGDTSDTNGKKEETKLVNQIIYAFDSDLRVESFQEITEYYSNYIDDTWYDSLTFYIKRVDKEVYSYGDTEDIPESPLDEILPKADYFDYAETILKNDEETLKRTKTDYYIRLNDVGPNEIIFTDEYKISSESISYNVSTKYSIANVNGQFEGTREGELARDVTSLSDLITPTDNIIVIKEPSYYKRLSVKCHLIYSDNTVAIDYTTVDYK